MEIRNFSRWTISWDDEWLDVAVVASLSWAKFEGFVDTILISVIL